MRWNGVGRNRAMSDPFLRDAGVSSAVFATAVGVALGAPGAAHATFIIDLSCGESKCDGGTDFKNDKANKDVSTFTGTVGGHAGTSVTVDTIGNVDTGAGFSTITPTSGALLTSLTFTPSNDTLFTDFSFRGQLNRLGDTSSVDVSWTDSSGISGSLSFSGLAGPDADFKRLGFVSTDETLASVTISTTAGESFKEFKEVQFLGGVDTTVNSRSLHLGHDDPRLCWPWLSRLPGPAPRNISFRINRTRLEHLTGNLRLGSRRSVKSPRAFDFWLFHVVRLEPASTTLVLVTLRRTDSR